MKTFFQWAEEKKLELPVVENTKRAGFAHWAYPDAYVRQQYPDQYFAPIAADHAFKLGSKSPSRKAPSDSAP